MLRLTGFSLTCLAAVLAFSPTEAAAQNKFKCATAAVNDPSHECCKRLAAGLTEKSGGKIVGEVYPSGQLGDVPAQVQGVQLGTIEAMAAPGPFFTGADPRFQVLDAPGVFESIPHFMKTIADTKFRDKFLSAGEAKGLVGLSVFLQAPNGVVSKKPIRVLDDLKGLKLRVFGSPLQVEPMRALGAAPAPLPLGESLPALQTGAIDGSIGTQFVFSVFKYHTVAKYVTRMPFSYVTIFGTASKAWFDKLPADQQKLARDIGKQLDVEVSEWAAKALPVMEKMWTDNGGELIDLPPAEMKKLMDITQPIGANVMKERPQVQELYQDLLAAAKKAKG